MPGRFYKVLEIEKNASDADIKKAYRKMAIKCPGCGIPSDSLDRGANHTFCRFSA